MNTRQEAPILFNKAKNAINKIMNSIEEDKDKLSDAEYLELCNKVKIIYNHLNEKYNRR
jgi:hypothetical protein